MSSKPVLKLPAAAVSFQLHVHDHLKPLPFRMIFNLVKEQQDGKAHNSLTLGTAGYGEPSRCTSHVSLRPSVRLFSMDCILMALQNSSVNNLIHIMALQKSAPPYTRPSTSR
jgi:hypothetical protein